MKHLPLGGRRVVVEDADVGVDGLAGLRHHLAFGSVTTAQDEVTLTKVFLPRQQHDVVTPSTSAKEECCQEEKFYQLYHNRAKGKEK